MNYIVGRQTRYGQNGNIGGIPQEYVQERYEQTCLFSPEDLLEEDRRDILKNNRPEAPSFEQDMPRSDTSRKIASKNFLNNIYRGRRADHEPSHPDLYIANTERDPRGFNIEPNMLDYRKGVDFRTQKYKDFVSTATSDQTEDTGVVSEHAMNAKKIATRGDFRKRANWFGTSLQAEYHGAVREQTAQSKIKYIKRDDNNNDKVPIIDASPTLFTPSQVFFEKPGRAGKIVGSRVAPTHRFEVAKYGRAPKSHRMTYDAQKHRANSQQTMGFKESEQNTMRNLAIFMSAESGKAKYKIADPTKDFDTSAEPFVNGQNGKKQANVRKAMNNCVGEQDIVEDIVVILETKAKKHKNIGDIRKQRYMVYFDGDQYDESEMSSVVRNVKIIDDPFTNSVRTRRGVGEGDFDDAKETQIYSKSWKPTVEQLASAKMYGVADYELDDGKDVDRGRTARLTKDVKNHVVDYRLGEEMKHMDSAIGSKIIGPVGRKNTVRSGQRYEPWDNGMNGIESGHSR